MLWRSLERVIPDIRARAEVVQIGASGPMVPCCVLHDRAFPATLPRAHLFTSLRTMQQLCRRTLLWQDSWCVRERRYSLLILQCRVAADARALPEPLQGHLRPGHQRRQRLIPWAQDAHQGAVQARFVLFALLWAKEIKAPCILSMICMWAPQT